MTTEVLPINVDELPKKYPSLCIPHVLSEINEKHIYKTFNELELGSINRIHIINKKNQRGQTYNCVYIHFNHWFNTENSKVARERLINGKDIKIMYDEPWFWKISMYNDKKHKNQMT